MLNPLEFCETIDACIAEHGRTAQPVHAGRVADAILATLLPEDRQGVDPELLHLIVTARSFRYLDRADTAAVAA